MQEKLEGVGDILACLQRLAEKDVRVDLKNEVERWRVRFELMSRLSYGNSVVNGGHGSVT
ncbi:MAG TPA: hypothetical protein VKE22_06540 [Haliangiales bacterium]|nr:hypothetical protein [Haliangiales bacterium]